MSGSRFSVIMTIYTIEQLSCFDWIKNIDKTVIKSETENKLIHGFTDANSLIYVLNLDAF